MVSKKEWKFEVKNNMFTSNDVSFFVEKIFFTYYLHFPICCVIMQSSRKAQGAFLAHFTL